MCYTFSKDVHIMGTPQNAPSLLGYSNDPKHTVSQSGCGLDKSKPGARAAISYRQAL